MVLNSSRLIADWRSRYCGMILYLSNSACQAAASNGGKTPVTGFHSTIESPDSVSRVAPPTTRVTAISAATASSHSRRARGLDRGSEDDAGMITSVAWKRRRPYRAAKPCLQRSDNREDERWITPHRRGGNR